jgi:hypothetical protein
VEEPVSRSGIERLPVPFGVRDAASALGVHPNTIKRISPGDLPYFTVGSGKRQDRRYQRVDVEAYIAHHAAKEAK